MGNEDVVVVGAGVAGCTLGHLLTREGFDVTILEKGAIGGLLREIEFETEMGEGTTFHLRIPQGERS